MNGVEKAGRKVKVLNNERLREKLYEWGACDKAKEWLGFDRDSEQMWTDCGRPDWLMWFIGNSQDKKRVVAVLHRMGVEVLGEERTRLNAYRDLFEFIGYWLKGDFMRDYLEVNQRSLRRRVNRDSCTNTYWFLYTIYAIMGYCEPEQLPAHAADSTALLADMKGRHKSKLLAIIRDEFPTCPWKKTDWRKTKCLPATAISTKKPKS